MVCPCCGSEMRDGFYAVRSSVWRYLVVGLSWESLWFYPVVDERTGKRELALNSGPARWGFKCSTCGASVIPGPPTPPPRA
jgi:hypothetical protein